MQKKEEGVRVNLLLKGKLVRHIDNYRFLRRFPNRTATIEHLLEWAVKQNPPKSQEPAE